MSLPLAWAIPAFGAVAAYTNAKLRITPDLEMLRMYMLAFRKYLKRDTNGRGGIFYVLEDHVADPSIADRMFMLYEDKSWTFKECYDMMLRYAGWLYSIHGVGSGHIVALDFMNCPEYLFIVLAC